MKRIIALALVLGGLIAFYFWIVNLIVNVIVNVAISEAIRQSVGL